MKALIAAGGHATRLRPITWTRNKHLIPLANKPMLWHVFKKVTEAGIRDILVNVNPGEMDDMHSVFGNGEQFGASLTYVEQRGGAKGLAHVVANAREQLAGEKFLFFLGDNIILGSIQKYVERFERERLDCMIALSRVSDPRAFGVPEFHPDGTLKRTIEKPAVPPSPFAVTGIYLFNDRFFEAFKTLTPSARGEYEITDVITWYIHNGSVGYEEITGWWKDTGTPAALIEGNALIMDDLPKDEFCQDGEISPDAVVEGPVAIGKGTVIGPGCVIRGPVIIGESCTIEASYIGPYTSIGNRVTLKGAEVEHSIVFDDASIESPRRVTDSLIGVCAHVADHGFSQPKSGHRLIVGDNSFVEL